MKGPVKLGVVCLARATFDFEAAEGLYRGILDDLRMIENAQIAAYDALVLDPGDAVKAANMFAAELVDGVIVISGTFHLGHLILELKKRADKPLLLWALPELPYNGGKIRLNSVCGVNLNASNLYKSGFRDYGYTVGMKIDEDWVDAVRMIRAMREARLGLIGSHAHGFFNVDVDELSLYGKFGATVDHFPLHELWEIQPDRDAQEHFLRKMKSGFDLSALTEEKAQKVAALAAMYQAFATKHGLTAVATRCWPEFAAGYGISPCAAMSLAQSEGLPLACEGDVDCALTMICHQAAGAVTPYMADLSQVNPGDNSALMWHCGVAPSNLADGVCAPTMDMYFAGGRGVTAGFVLKPGQISMARLDSVAGCYRLFSRVGEAMPMKKELAGTYARVRFQQPMQEMLETVLYSGIAHHVSMAYGDFSKSFKIMARLKDIGEV